MNRNYDCEKKKNYMKAMIRTEKKSKQIKEKRQRGKNNTTWPLASGLHVTSITSKRKI